MTLEELRKIAEARTKGEWSQGRTLLTRETKNWPKDIFEQSEWEENQRIFANFSEKDLGRSRYSMKVNLEFEEFMRVVCRAYQNGYGDAIITLNLAAPDENKLHEMFHKEFKDLAERGVKE